MNDLMQDFAVTLPLGFSEHVDKQDHVNVVFTEKAVDPVTLTGSITKLDEEQRLVFGWASVVEKDGVVVVDRQGDMISEVEMEKAAYSFVLDSRDAGDMHERVGVGKLVESIAFTKEKQKALGIDLGKVGWFLGFKISDDNVWSRIKDGTYKAFSIAGRGKRSRA